MTFDQDGTFHRNERISPTLGLKLDEKGRIIEDEYHKQRTPDRITLVPRHRYGNHHHPAHHRQPQILTIPFKTQPNLTNRKNK